MRAVVSARVSSITDQGQVGHDVQTNAGIRYARQHGWEVVGTVADLDVSATISPWDRPDLGPWLAEKSNLWDVMIFSKVDRAFRSIFDCADIARWAESNKKMIVFTDDGITLNFRDDDDSFGNLMAKVFLVIASLFAELELRRIQKRVRDAQAHLRTTDRWAGGPAPYGYRIDRRADGKYLVLDPDAANVIRYARDLILSGKSLVQTAEILTEKGFPTPTQTLEQHSRKDLVKKRRKPITPRWNYTSVHKILNSPSTMGYKVVSMNNRRVVARGPDGLPIRVAEPVFTDEEWNQLQNALNRQVRTRERSKNAAPLLGIAICGTCGTRLYRRWSSTRKYQHYVCPQKPGKPGCPGHSFRADELQEFLDFHVKEDLQIPVMEKVYIQGNDVAERLAYIAKAMREVRREKDQGLYDYEGGEEDYQTRLQALLEQRKALESMPRVASRWEERPTGKTYAEAYAEMDEEQRRRLLLDAGIRLELKPLNWTIVVPENLRARITASRSIESN